MPIDVKEVSKFTSGIIGASSETDIGDDFATFSLDVDSEFERGALRGIKGNYILGQSGWELPRYSRWRLRFSSDTFGQYNTRGFLLYAYNKTYLIHYYISDTIPAHIEARASEKNWTVVNININNYTDKKQFADATISAINALEPSAALKKASGIDKYFTSFYTTNSDLDAFVTIRSYFVGRISKPSTTNSSLSWSTYNLSLKTSETNSYVIFPEEEKFDLITSPLAWDSAKDGKFVEGNGIIPEITSDIMPYGFKFLKNLNQKGESSIFGISSDSKAQIIENIGIGSTSITYLASVSSSVNKFDISAEQRNKNLFIGTGNDSGSKSLWLGKIDRKQIDREYNDTYMLESSSLSGLDVNNGDISVDNLVIPTLHYGLNDTNGGIAGSSSIYSQVNGNDWQLASLTSSTYIRSVNQWAEKCLTNAGLTIDNYDDFKKGMILRLDLKGAFVASSKNLEGTSSHTGTDAFSYLESIKSFAKGSFNAINQTGPDNPISSTTGGSDGEALHSGDLFQIVHVPAAATTSSDTFRSAVDTEDKLIRFAYVGHLSSADDFTSSNKTSYSGTPAYAFGHINDTKMLARFKLTSKNNEQITNEINTVTVRDSDGNVISQKFGQVDYIDLEDELGIPGFQISTISECKSADGAGNFGGDTTNKNYYMGYGKLWVANRNEHDKIYLVDISNWDNINSSEKRVTCLIVDLNFDRLHSTLFSKDDTTFGEGLVRLWNGANANTDYDNIIGDYLWEPEPTNQYISSICETYSHQSHLGDGAGGGAANGDGKWRVWVTYDKDNDMTHDRWDLFLFNFRPQAWSLYSGATDVQSALSSASPQVFMFDKTPPYQECAYIIAESSTKIYYPYDKFAAVKAKPNEKERIHFDDSENGAEPPNNAPAKFGKEFISIRGCTTRWDNGQDVWRDNLRGIEFRNPSGEHFTWYRETEDNGYRFSLGTNIGWTIKNFRKWSNFRHCLKPHFKQWYFTGNGTSSSDREPREELGNKVAHIVSFFGKLSGKFVEHGGYLETTSNNSDDFGWGSAGAASIASYTEDIVMFSMHDSPVALSTISGGNNEATFTSGEIQGRPNVTSGTPTAEITTDGVTRTHFNDTEAGWRTDNSVPATQGYSRFNQYRYNHDHNGSKDLYDDSGNGTNRKGYINTPEGATGGAYYGSDGFGHYNMVTVTWASNQDTQFTSGSYRSNPLDSIKNHERIYGYGLEYFSKLDKYDNNHSSRTGFRDVSDNLFFQSGQSYADIAKVADTMFGTGYLTYRYPHTEDPSLAGADGVAADFGDYGDKNSGFYTTSDLPDFEHTNSGTEPSGSYWDNRKSVFCWSTTALTDSVFKNTDRTLDKHHYDNRFNLLISPRCSFRKVVLPSGYKFSEINNVDFISWQEIYHNEIVSKHGYIVSGKADLSPIKDSEISSSIVTILDNKCIDDYRKKGSGVSASDENHKNDSWSLSQSKAAKSNLVPLQKQVTVNQNSYYNQIVSYTNDYFVFKNLNTGISDGPDFYTNLREMQSNLPDQPQNTAQSLFDTYSPLIIGYNGDNNKETLSNWSRPQFTQTSGSMGSMGDYPFYKYDRLWNYWATDERSPNNQPNISLTNDNVESGFDHSVLKNNETIKLNKRPTEGWGSTAGTLRSGTGDGLYPTDYDNVNNNINAIGAHTKIINTSILEKYHEEAADFIVVDGENENIGVEFKEGSIAYYKVSFTYDGFQESPLSDHTFDIEITKDCKFISLIVKVPNAASFHINSRVTHINIYRKNELKTLYRLTKSISFNQKDDIFILTDNMYEYKFNDEGTTISYEGLNGISETLKHLTPNYALSCQLNDFLFVSKIYHKKIDNGSHILLRSKQGKFSIFDWSNDYLDLPMQPKAMASFANRIFLFDENNTYIVNPEGMYIEEKTEGVGILNSQSVVVTDDGMFFADRNNIYAHNGRNSVPIGGPILYNHSRPEWQIGYLDAINKAESLGYTPRVIYDSIKKSIYIILQGFTDADNGISGSYETNKTRIYSYSIDTKRWDYYNSPNINSAIVTNKGDVILNDGYQLYNYRIDKRNRKSFTWESKEFIMGSSNYDKVFKRLYVTGELCLLNFNNIDQNSQYNEEEESYDWGQPPNPTVDEGVDYNVINDEHLLNVSEASESDDLKVYVDGVLKTMRVQNRKPHIGHYLANDKTGSLYTIETQLPAFETSNNGLVDVDGNPIKNAFSLNKNSLPEFIDTPNSQYPSTTKQGELSELVHLHRGQYLYISGTIAGNKVKEIVKVKKLHLKWSQTEGGLNEILDSNSIIVEVYRGLIGTKAQNWSGLNVTDIEQIRIVTPVLKFPSGTKGKNVKIVYSNQKSYIDSFAITYRKTRMK